MQPSAASVICFSWREIEASRGRIFLEDGNDSPFESNDGIQSPERILDNPENEAEQYCRRQEQRSELPSLGGELSRPQWLVHRPVSGTIRFSYR